MNSLSLRARNSEDGGGRGGRGSKKKKGRRDGAAAAAATSSFLREAAGDPRPDRDENKNATRKNERK
jgi:hypothetical protein